MTRTYTAADFANARFAEHPDGRLAVRADSDSEPWDHSGDWHSDSAMANGGWVPVPTKPTITRSEFLAAVDDVLVSQYATTEARCQEFAQSLGIEVIPDPEPTNTEKLEQLIRESGLTVSDHGIEGYAAELAASLDEDGVTAPKEGK